MIEGGPSPSTADRAFLRAIRSWCGGEFAGVTARLSEAWRDRLRASWPSAALEKPAVAWSALRGDHEASSRFDPSRVHPSWFVRALRNESPAVRHAIAAHVPSTLGRDLCRGLGIDSADLATDREPDPEAIAWALALWSERLVGDVPGLESDPPVVVALSRLGPRDLLRLVKACGLAKHAFALAGMRGGIDESTARLTPIDRVRFGYFRRHIGEPDPRLVPAAKLDLGAIEVDRRRALARAGLLSIGRLLGAVESHRARWASQHVPYPVARLLRIKEASPLSARSLLAWESWVLEAAWSRLLAEGRLAGGRRPATGAGVAP